MAKIDDDEIMKMEMIKNDDNNDNNADNNGNEQ